HPYLHPFPTRRSSDLHADGNGNITYMVSSSQTLSASYKYDAFGNLFTGSGSLAFINTYRFSSKEIHVQSGYYYYGYRWYDPFVRSEEHTSELQSRENL